MAKRTKNATRDAGGAGLWGLVAVALVTAVIAAACAPAGGPNDRATLEAVKHSVYGDQADADAIRVAGGSQQPVVEFTVEGTPPSIFVNWIVPDEKADDFTSFIDLPPGFTLSKVRILESDPVPRYWLSLNVYKVSGITTGLRAEWSTYVDDGSGTPRFMIIRARAAEGSLDPIGPLALPEPFTHSVDAGVISTAMKQTVIQNSVPVLTPDDLFTSTIGLPDPVDRNYVEPTLEWVGANDFIYWMNGVNDRTFYNSSAHSAPLISVDLADVTLADDTEWVPFVDPVPAHVLVYLAPIQFVIGPWWNVTELDGLVDPATRATLFDLKKQLYGGLTSVQALAVRSGNAEPLVQSTVEGTPRSVYWHWEIPDGNLADFEAALDLPPGLSLTTVRLQDGDAEAAHWLTLNVEQVTGAQSGLRAEWSTHVDDGEGTRVLTLEARADHPSLDPTKVVNTTSPFTPSYPLSHTFVADTVNTTVGSGATAFSSSFVVPPAGPGTTIGAAREWVGANDIRYWMNGIADRVYYGSAVFDPKISVDPATVTVNDGGQWAEFVGASPDRVWVDEGGADTVSNPWWNL